MQISPDFSPLGLAVAVPLAAYLVTLAPFTGRHSYERLRRTRETDPKALTRLYSRWIASTWLAAAIAAAAMWLSPGVGPADLGLAVPDDPALATGQLAGILIVTVVATVVTNRKIRSSGGKIPGQAHYEALIPRTGTERGLALAMSVTAGICEEFVFRGLLIALGVAAGLGLYAAAALAVVLFGAGHLYQGLTGMLATGYIGAIMTVLYLGTGSLLIPIVAHALVDIRGLVFVPSPRRTSTTMPAATSTTPAGTSTGTAPSTAPTASVSVTVK